MDSNMNIKDKIDKLEKYLTYILDNSLFDNFKVIDRINEINDLKYRLNISLDDFNDPSKSYFLNLKLNSCTEIWKIIKIKKFIKKVNDLLNIVDQINVLEYSNKLKKYKKQIKMHIENPIIHYDYYELYKNIEKKLNLCNKKDIQTIYNNSDYVSKSSHIDNSKILSNESNFDYRKRSSSIKTHTKTDGGITVTTCNINKKIQNDENNNKLSADDKQIHSLNQKIEKLSNSTNKYIEDTNKKLENFDKIIQLIDDIKKKNLQENINDLEIYIKKFKNEFDKSEIFFNSRICSIEERFENHIKKEYDKTKDQLNDYIKINNKDYNIINNKLKDNINKINELEEKLDIERNNSETKLENMEKQIDYLKENIKSIQNKIDIQIYKHNNFENSLNSNIENMLKEINSNTMKISHLSSITLFKIHNKVYENSKILIGKDIDYCREFFYSLLGCNKKLYLLKNFNSSNFSKEDFYQNIIGKRDILILLENNKNKKFGFFYSNSIGENNFENYISDRNAFIFNLPENIKDIKKYLIRCEYENEAIFIDHDVLIGLGNKDLEISINCFGNSNYCYLPESFYAPEDAYKDITGENSFRLIDLEIYQVT